MKVALVHEFLTQLGGAERVLETFHEFFPEAPVYTLIYDPAKTRGIFDEWDVRTSFLQKFPAIPKHYKWYLPLMPKAIESFDFSGYDLVISDSSAFAKGIITKKPTLHICYCHTPTRYLWESLDEYVDSQPYPKIIKAALRLYLKKNLKKWDLKASKRPDFIIANSETVRDRIRKYYSRESEIIPPPVDTDFFKPVSPKSDFFFTASRLEPYKKIHLVVEAFKRLGLPLKVAGDGTELASLKEIGGPTVEFLGKVTDEKLRELYSQARAFVFPPYEDAGIMPLESLACGTPVIGLSSGGTAEFIKDRETGVLFAKQNVESIAQAVKKFETLYFDPAKLRANALPYSKQNFANSIQNFLNRVLKQGTT
ncbi:glycosyltransferase family 4 protein [bacterium]|nr:MAG: glycosyltransferase family 4 protein [bacterium]